MVTCQRNDFHTLRTGIPSLKEAHTYISQRDKAGYTTVNFPLVDALRKWGRDARDLKSDFGLDQ